MLIIKIQFSLNKRKKVNYDYFTSINLAKVLPRLTLALPSAITISPPRFLSTDIEAPVLMPKPNSLIFFSGVALILLITTCSPTSREDNISIVATILKTR